MNDSFNDSYYDMDYEDEVCEKGEVVKFGSIAIPVFFSIVITLSLTGNLLVLAILALYENLKSLTNIFILNLAISDLVFTIGLPFWAIYHIWGWVFSEALCKIVTFVFFTGFYSSILFLTIMTIYRYLAVVQPLPNLSTQSLSTGVYVSFLLWIISIGAAIPSLLYSSLVSIPHNGTHSMGCEYEDPMWKSIGVFQQNIFFLIAFAVMAFCYIQLLWKITRTRSHAKNRAVKLVFCIVAVFFLGWVPYNVIIFLRVLSDNVVAPFDNCDASINLDYAFYVCRLIAFSNCCLNPVFYAFVGVKFRSHLKSLLLRLFIRSTAEEQQMELWILIGLNIITKVYGYSNGNFPEVCGSLLPAHKIRDGPLLPPQTLELPFVIDVEPGIEGDPVTVHLKSNSSTKFKGFMLEAFERGKNGTVLTGRAVGRFIDLDPKTTRLLTCYGSAAAAVSQKNNAGKTSFRVNWTQDASVDITFRATFLKDFRTFWINVTEDLILTAHTTPIPTTTRTSTPSTQPSTTTSTEASTTTSTEASITTSTGPSTTTSTETSTTQLPDDNILTPLEKAILVMTADSFSEVLSTEVSNIILTVSSKSLFSRRLVKGSQISGSLLCAALEISSLVLFCVADPIKVPLVALVCVVIVINFIKLVIVCLPMGPSHELKEICDYAVKACSVIHQIFTMAVIFIGVLEVDNDSTASWLLEVMVAFTVFLFLFLIWIFVSSTQRNAILGTNKEGSQNNSQRWRQQRKEKKLSAAQGMVIAVSVIFIFVNLCFAVAVTVGILRY